MKIHRITDPKTENQAAIIIAFDNLQKGTVYC